MRHYIYITDDYWSKIELHLFFGKNKLSYLQCCHLREKMVQKICNIWFGLPVPALNAFQDISEHLDVYCVLKYSLKILQCNF